LKTGQLLYLPKPKSKFVDDINVLIERVKENTLVFNYVALANNFYLAVPFNIAYQKLFLKDGLLLCIVVFISKLLLFS